MTKNNAFRRGFTLIELMIVIVILGILMGTILPRLTGAQSRARDTARIADLNNISQALEVYSSDFGEYPAAACATADIGDNCLDIACVADTDTYTLLKTYMKGDRVPQNVGKKTVSLGCDGSYYYSPLRSGGTDQGSYVLASDIETWQMANYEANADAADPPTADEFESGDEASTHIPNIKEQIDAPEEGDSEQKSIFIVIP
ncbi:prepilin-type N-terminal cleavage/methylation domain-containing protein [Patescibacteria group bacterium]|nr:prepilin-type N-terminal cleavage/methylation domain-containing protein [Patescibacteria group bacterium]